MKMSFAQSVIFANELVNGVGFHRVLSYLAFDRVLVALVLTALWFTGERGAMPTTPHSYTRLQSRTRVIIAVATLLLMAEGAGLLSTYYPTTRPLENLPLYLDMPPDERVSWLAANTGPVSPPLSMMMMGGLLALLSRYGRSQMVLGGGLALATFIALIGTGQHWPLPLLILLGVGAVGVLLTLLVLEAVAARQFTPLLLALERRAALAYPLLFLLFVDFTRGFVGVRFLVSMWGGASLT